MSLPYIAEMARLNASLDSSRRSDIFYDELKRFMELCRDEMLWKRNIVYEYFDKNFFPMTKGNLKRGFSTFFTTIGFIGLWEAVAILTDNDDSFLEYDGMNLAVNILNFMKQKTDCFTTDTGKLFNLEATPAESASYKLAQKAIRVFPNIRHAGLKKAPYFTNSCHVPAERQDDLSLILNTQTKLQTIPNGGTVTHFYIGEQLTAAQVETFVKSICQTKIPYFSATVVYSMCEVCGRIAGAHDECPNEHTPEQIEWLRQTKPELLIDEE